jgi:hypothetical protein
MAETATFSALLFDWHLIDICLKEKGEVGDFTPRLPELNYCAADWLSLKTSSS